jgi:gamma-butyrobetaine dioxygenase
MFRYVVPRQRTCTKSITPNVKNQPRQLFKSRNNYSTVSGSLLTTPAPKLINFQQASTSRVKLVWDDQTTSEFHSIWLRDNCPCNACLHPETKQKLLDTPELPLEIAPKSLSVDSSGSLRIVWDHENHTSVYSPQLLKKLKETSSKVEYDSVKLPTMELWEASTIEKQRQNIQFEAKDVLENDQVRDQWLKMMYTYGVTFVKNVPCQENEILKVAERMGPVKDTVYGLTFDVVSKATPDAHLAYTGRELKHHTDMNYKENSPGVQFLHCLKSRARGGQSLFVDGFYAANWLKQFHPQSFQLLSSVRVPFVMKTGASEYRSLMPIIGVVDGQLSEVHVNNRTMKELSISDELVVPFYYAYKLLTQKLRETSSEFVFDLKEGDIVVFNNRRVLHGRTAFDPSSGDRHLQGCYVDMDDFVARLRVAMKKSNNNNNN